MPLKERKNKVRSTRRIPERGVVGGHNVKRRLSKSKQSTGAIGSTQRDVMRRLVRECKIMETRVQAILDFALDGLVPYDVFGNQYEKLLKADLRWLRRAVVMGERDLAEVVDITETVEV